MSNGIRFVAMCVSEYSKNHRWILLLIQHLLAG
jgi:hypothetical protein